jgi:hypothetical protein
LNEHGFVGLKLQERFDDLVKEHQARFKEPPDFFTCGGFAAAMATVAAIEKAKKVKFVILDIHGILTDNTLYYTDDGKKSECFFFARSFGLQSLDRRRYRSGIFNE